MSIELAQPISEWQLIQASAAGDERAFEQLYQHYSRRVYSLCLRLLGNPADAEDVTQEVFLQVHRKLKTFRGDAAFTTWLYRLTVNAALMHLRKSIVRHEQAEEDEQIKIFTDQAARERPNRLLDRLALERAIQALPPGYRTVFIHRGLRARRDRPHARHQRGDDEIPAPQSPHAPAPDFDGLSRFPPRKKGQRPPLTSLLPSRSWGSDLFRN